MSIDPSLGKTWGLRRMATAAGHFAMVALDQRPPIAALIAARRGVPVAEVAFRDMVDVKRVIVEAVAAQASAVLFDPNYAVPAAIGRLSPRTGLVLTLEDHRFEDTDAGRKSHSIADWSVAKIKRAGADGVKVLAWYRPDAGAEVLAHQQAYVEAVGAECRRQDIAFVLELLVYPFPQSAGHSLDYAEAPLKMPEHVLASVREFAQPRYGVDLFKLESPLPGAGLPKRDGSAAHRQAEDWFARIGALCAEAGIPWVMLSAGVTATQFLRVMEYAYGAGANGFLAGRAIWWEAMQHFPDLAACAGQLREQGSATLRELAQLTLRAGRAWQPDYGALDAIAVEGELCAAYA